MKHCHGRPLTIVSDCHSSGHWVSECAQFLDEQGVKPCGHSSEIKGILLKVFAACKTGQNTAELCYTTRAMDSKDDGCIHQCWGMELNLQQTTFGVDFTDVRCTSRTQEECCIASESTWSTAGEVTSGRIRLLLGHEQGCRTWQYILLDDDVEKMREFKQKVLHGNVYATDYGIILHSGRGGNPPLDWIETYGWS